MSGGSASMSTSLASFWKDDFGPLQFAGRKILLALREDETAPDADLYRRISSSSSASIGGNGGNQEPSSHCYIAPHAPPANANGDGAADGMPTTPTGNGINGINGMGFTSPAASSAFSFSSSAIVPRKAAPTSAQMKHERSIQLPPVLIQQMRSVQKSMYMGLFPEAKLGWLAVDDKLFLWNISHRVMDPTNNQDILSFSVPTKRPIISVGIAPPKPGVFKNVVEWCLIVTTSEQAYLCALARPPVQPVTGAIANPMGTPMASRATTPTYAPLKLVPTRFVIPSDWINYLSVAGNKQGRIFLGGQDGNVYEMDYDGVAAATHIQRNQRHPDVEKQLDEFYDESNSSCPEVVIDHNGSHWTLAGHMVQTGRDVISSVLTKATKSSKPNKCRKFNHSNPDGIVSAIVPDFVQSLGRSILGVGNGTTTGGGPIVQMVVDEERHILYTLSSRGWICALDIYHDGSSKANGSASSATGGTNGASNGGFGLGLGLFADPPQAKVVAVLDAPKTARLYLEAVSRGRMYPPSNSSFSSTKSEGIITFPGGGIAAQAGVGGMDGARTILKLADASTSVTASGRRRVRTKNSSNSGGSVLTPVSIHLVPRRESAHLTLVAVTAGGLRYYLSTLTPQTVTSGLSARQRTSFAASQNRPRDDPMMPHSKFSFCHIRAPPPLTTVTSNNTASHNPNRTPRSSQSFGWHSMSDIGQAASSSPSTVLNRLLAPRMVSGIDRMPRVDASWYRMGVFVVALKTTKSSNSSSFTGAVPTDNRDIVGNLIVTSCADSVARIPQNKPRSSSADDSMSPSGSSYDRALVPTSRGTEQLVTPGGICEAISLPMSEAYGSINSHGNLEEVLPGGRVWDIGSASESDPSILHLALRSKTPTDSELNIGLVPPYHARVRGLGVGLNGSNKPSAVLDSTKDKRLIAVGQDSQTIASTAMQMVMNVVFSRPLSYGMPGRRSARGANGVNVNGVNGGATQPQVPQLYRISKRGGWQGFSLTAGEVKSSTRLPSASLSRRALPRNVGNKSKSARLSPWLLRPSIVPLNPLAVQHILPDNQTVALNVNGLHFFQTPSILTNLADALVAAGVNEASDSAVSAFFSSYGYKEGCSMCLLLAIGYGPSGLRSSDEFKSRAAHAAFSRAHVPTLTRVSTETGAPTQTQTSAEVGSLVPPGYSFRPSALCEGLGLVISRLLRPVWNKPAVVVTEGRIIRRSMSIKSQISPAKVELLLDNETIDEIRQPLIALRTLMRKAFTRAIEAVPGAPSNDTMETDENAMGGQDHFLTRALEYQVHSRTGSGGVAQLRSAEAEEIARMLEERIIHCYYRLISRTIQLFNLLVHLRRAQTLQELPEVEWGVLHGVSFAQLVETRGGQERLETVLNGLMTPTNANPGTAGAAPSAHATQLAELLSSECFHFFSRGSRYSYSGFRAAAEALACPSNTTRRVACAKEAIGAFMQASRNWHSAPLITGRILHSKERESYREIAENALRFDSPLANAVALLVELGEVAAAVTICIRTAGNFSQGTLRYASDSSELMIGNDSDGDVMSWEHGLYHKKRDSNDDGGSAMTTGSSTSSPSSSTALALGLTVTSKDAIKTCHALIFHHLTQLLESPHKVHGENMISACAAVNDKEFLHAFFAHMVDINHKDTLLRIDSPDLEKWLQECAATSSQSDLLWNYYIIQGKHFQAGEQAWKVATSQTDDIHLNSRIEYLVRAGDAFGMAMQSADQSYGAMQWNASGSLPAHHNREEVARNELSVRETLSVTRIQSRILHRAQNSKYELPPEDLNQLSFTLVAVSDLYNKYAAPLDMYDICLIILHTCRHDERETIEELWKSVLCEEIMPCNTRDDGIFMVLRELAEGSHTNEPAIRLLDGGAVANDRSTPLFEDGIWLKKLEGRVGSLGKELFGTGADYIFPVDFLMSWLEKLHRVMSNAVPSSSNNADWIFTLLINAGVPYMTTLDGYDRIIEGEDHAVMGGLMSDRRVRHFASIIGMLEGWVKEANQAAYGAENAAAIQLSDALATGAFSRRLESYKAQLRTLPEAHTVDARFDALQRFIGRL